jgi:alpha-glucosidase
LFSCYIFNTKAQNITPDWHQKSVVYQIYPLSFQDSNGDGIGDIKGIISRLDYLQSLGINTIWLSPVYPSPWVDHGYDISNYKNIHPRLGDLNEMDELIAETKKRNIHLLMDLVMNHTSDQHPWFQASRKDSVDGQFRSMYIWKEGKKKPNNWKSMIGGNGWQYDEVAKAWYWASFLGFQPDLNYHNPVVKDSMFSVMDFWIKRGVDGFRLDIFNCLAEDTSFKNNPPSLRMIPSEANPNGFFQKPVHTQNTPATFVISQEFRQRLDSISNRHAFSVGEVFGPPELLRSYTENNQGLHSVFLFKTLHAGFNANKWKKLIQENEIYFSDPLLPTWVLSNHDKKRFISRIGNHERKMRCVIFMQLTQRGVPFIYQGEELGMRQQKLNPKYSHDPVVKKYGAAAARISRISGEAMNRDECRTPMAWNNKKNGGFSESDTTWLSVSKEIESINSETAIRTENSLYHHYHDLIALRLSSSIFTKGKTDSVLLKSKVLSYQRKYNGESITCYINFSKKKKKMDSSIKTEQIIFGKIESNKKNKQFLPAYSACIIKNG